MLSEHNLTFICLSLEERDSLLSAFFLKKPYFSIFQYLSISLYLRARANLGFSKKLG